jgi:hypothetical protein
VQKHLYLVADALARVREHVDLRGFIAIPSIGDLVRRNACGAGGSQNVLAVDSC